MRAALLLCLIATPAFAAEGTFTAQPLRGALQFAVNAAVPAKADPFVKQMSVDSDDTSPTTEEDTATSAVIGVMKANEKTFRDCYLKQLAQQKDLGGDMFVRFRIIASGAVDSATISSLNMKSPPVESCVLEQLKKIAFPKKASAFVIYPLHFTAQAK